LIGDHIIQEEPSLFTLTMSYSNSGVFYKNLGINDHSFATFHLWFSY